MRYRWYLAVNARWYTTPHKRRRLHIMEAGERGFVEHKVKDKVFEVYMQTPGVEYRLAPATKVFRTNCLFTAISHFRELYART